MDSIRLGLQPEPLEVLLSRDSDFTFTLRLDAGWPVGSVVTLVVGSVTWTASIAGTDALFSVDKAVANAVADRTPARLVYTNGATDQVWARGEVTRFDG